jgi:hypothetical protein
MMKLPEIKIRKTCCGTSGRASSATDAQQQRRLIFDNKPTEFFIVCIEIDLPAFCQAKSKPGFIIFRYFQNE